MVPSDWVLVTSYSLSSNNRVSICSGLATVFSGKFQAISGPISKMVRDKAKVTIDH